jgi:hypothetical protein
VDVITKFLQTSKTCHIREIHLINNNENIIKMLQVAFTPKTEKRHPPPTPKPNFTKPHHKDQYDTPKSSKKIQTWRMDTTAQMKTDVSKYMESYKQKTGNLVIIGDDDASSGDEVNCIICLSEMDDPVELVECKHVFCKDCIMECFGTKPSCPVCGKVYGIVYGDQPRDGTADIFEEEDSLPGYDKKKTYVIYYDFPTGKQEVCYFFIVTKTCIILMTIQTSLDTDICLFSPLQIICSICIDRQMYCPSMSRRNIVKQGCMAMEKLSLSQKIM